MARLSRRAPDAADDAPAMFDRPSTDLVLSGKQRDLIAAAAEIEMEDAREAGSIGYAARLWAQLTLPYKNPPAGQEIWVRRNGSLTLRVMPGVVRIDGRDRAAYPFGIYPRYILTYFASQAVRTRSPEVDLGRSLSDFMHRIGLKVTGGEQGTIARLNDQMGRLLTSSMYVENTRQDGDRWAIAGEHFSVAKSYRMWFDQNDQAGTNPLWGSTITLGKEFFESILQAPVPIDTRAMTALNSPLKIDLYVWLSHRLGYVRRPQTVPWVSLAQQFGSDYSRLRDFRDAMTRHLREVLAVYPGANVEVKEDGLQLFPSRTAVPRLPNR